MAREYITRKEVKISDQLRFSDSATDNTDNRQYRDYSTGSLDLRQAFRG
jgi:hypothetical protein